MYEAVYVEEDCNTTPARFASVASRCGYHGLIYFVAEQGERLATLSDSADIDVARGISIDAVSNDQVTNMVRSRRPAVDVIRVRADDADLQRFVAQRERVDVLAPGSPIAHTTAKTAGEHGIAIELDVGPILRGDGPDRTSAITTLRRNVRVVDHFDVPYVVTATAQSHLELRGIRELRSLGPAIGLAPSQVNDGLRLWTEIVARARRNRDDTFIEPGVRRVHDETDTG